jgi:hypothetical protein
MLKVGRRQEAKEAKKKVKNHIKAFYAILHELDDVASDIKADHPKNKYSDEFILEITPNYTDRIIGKLELSILSSKLNGAAGLHDTD